MAKVFGRYMSGEPLTAWKIYQIYKSNISAPNKIFAFTNQDGYQMKEEDEAYCGFNERKYNLVVARLDNTKNKQTIFQKNTKQIQKHHTSINNLLSKHQAKRPFHREIDEILKESHISRDAFNSCNLNGRHCKLLVQNSEVVFGDIKKLVQKYISNDKMKYKYEKVANQPNHIVKIERGKEEMEELKDALIHIIELTEDAIQNLGACISIFNRLTPPTKYELLIVKTATETFMRCWRALGIPLSPKAHFVDSHLYNHLVKYGAHGIYSEESIECLHARYNRYTRLYSNIRDKIHQDALIRRKLYIDSNLNFQLGWEKHVVVKAQKKKSRSSSHTNYASKFVQAIRKIVEEKEQESSTAVAIDNSSSATTTLLSHEAVLMDIESASHDNHDTSSNSNTKRNREQAADAINDEEGNASKRTLYGKSVPNEN